MINFLTQTTEQLQHEYKTLPAAQGVQIRDIIKAIQDKKPEQVLKQIDTTIFSGNYKKLSKKKAPELNQWLKESVKTEQAIDILIALYILAGEKAKLNWVKIQPSQTNRYRLAQEKKNDRALLYQLFENRPTKLRGLLIPEFSETTVVTAGPRKGEKFQLSYAPYLRRPMELASPSSSNQLVVLMFPAQSGKSAFLQIFHGYYAKEVPSEGLYVTSDLKQAKKAMERRFEPLFKSIGVTFRTQSTNPGSRKTGDVTFSKEFDGGNLDIATKNSSGDLASETKKVGSYDEIDRGKEILGVEGSSWDQFEARFNAWLGEAKLNVASTPTDVDVSAIYFLYLTGTQEEWFMPCPLCGKHQILEVRNKSGWGLTYKTKSDNVQERSVVYVCRYCSESFKEIRKFDMLQNGIWQLHPDATPPDDDYTASFHLTALNSMFYQWFKVAKKHELGLENPVKKKSFENLQMGWPFKETGARPKASAVMENKGNYQAGSVPQGVIAVVSGGDVQRGSDRWADMPEEKLEEEISDALLKGNAHEKKFPRLEFEWMGFGPGYRTWSIMYKVFYGRTTYAYAGAWEKLNDYATELQEMNGCYGFLRSDGHKFPVVKTLIDSGYHPDVSYQFSQRWGATFISKGAREIPAPKNQKNLALTTDNFLHYRIGKSTVAVGAKFYEIGTKALKQIFYGSLKINRIEHDIQLPGFQDFPLDAYPYDMRYFEMLTAEEKLSETGNYDPGSRPNEALDCRILCKVAEEAYIDEFTEKQKAIKKESGQYSQRVINEAINHKYTILLLSKQAGIDPRFNEINYKRSRAS